MYKTNSNNKYTTSNVINLEIKKRYKDINRCIDVSNNSNMVSNVK